MNKECFKCNLKKDLAEFYKHPQMKDGHLNKCKECSKIDVRSNYRANIEHYKEYEKARGMLDHRVKARADYAETENGKKSIVLSADKWKKRNPIKRGAAHIVNNAVRNGMLTKPINCEICNCESNLLHGHHDDYAFPLVVRWLCPVCHNRWHKENGAGKNG